MISEEGTRELIAQVRDSYARVVYSHKVHEKCADIALGRLNQIKLSQIILSALATTGFIAMIFGHGRTTAIVGSLISTLLLVLNLCTRDHDLGRIAQKHRATAADLWLLRERYLSLLADLHGGMITPLEARTVRDEITARLHAIYKTAPSTSKPSYKAAKEALESLEELSFTSAEIDSFLPQNLREKSVPQARPELDEERK